MNTRGTRIIRSFSILSAAQIGRHIIAFVTTIYLTRTLGSEQFGIIVFAAAVVPYAGIITNFGFNALGQLKVARDPGSLHALTGAIVGLRLLFTIVAFGLLLLFVGWTSISDLAKIITLIYGFSLLSEALGLKFVFLGTEYVRPTAFAEVIAQGVMLVGALIFIRNPNDVIWMPFVFLTSSFVSSIILGLAFLRTYGWVKPEFNFALSKRLIREALPFAANNVVSLVTSNIDIILIGVWLNFEAAGLYGAAYRVIWIPTLLVMSYFTAMMPSLARGYVTGFETINNLVKRSMRLTSALAIGLVVGGVIVADPLIRFLFGQEFNGAAPPFQILIGATGLFIVNRQYRNLLAAFDLQIKVLKMNTAASFVNLALNLILISSYGLPAAAFARLISEIVILVMGYSYTRRFVGHLPFLPYFGKPLLAAGAMGLVLLATQSLHVLIRMSLGGGLFLAILFPMNIVHLQDIRQITKALLPPQLIKR